MRKLAWYVAAGAVVAGCSNGPSPLLDARPGVDVRDGGGGTDAPDVAADVAGDLGMDARPDVAADVPGPTDVPRPMDVPPLDGGAMTPTMQLTAVRAAPAGALNLPLDGVLVTYLVAAGGSATNDPAGFFVQSEMTGPALFVAVDPATLTPAPAVGDLVSFRVTMTATRGMARWATAVTGLTRASAGNPVAGLVQDVSAATDLVSNLAGYEAEMVRLSGTVRGDFAAAGTGFEAALLGTAGVAMDANLRLRVPAALRTTLGLRNGCDVTLTGSPMWRFNAQAQASAWVAGDITVGTCPPAMDAGTDASTDAAADVVPADVEPMDVVPMDVFIPEGGLAGVPTSAGQLVISEIMYNPDAVADPGGEWLEIYNPSAALTYELNGCNVNDASGTAGHTIAAAGGSLRIGPGAYVVLANSAAPGGFTPDYTYMNAFTLNNGGGGDTVTLTCSGTVIDRVVYSSSGDATTPFPTAAGGASIALRATALDATANDQGENWCVATTVYNTVGMLTDHGTPRAANDCP